MDSSTKSPNGNRGIPRDVLRRGCPHSLCFGAYLGVPRWTGGRGITDRARFAYLCDIFAGPAHRGSGIGKALVEAVLAHPDLRGVRRFARDTRDAQGLYARFGFRPLEDPLRHLERRVPPETPWGLGRRSLTAFMMHGPGSG